MNVNFGLFPPFEGKTRKADRKQMYTSRARAAFKAWQEPQRASSSLLELEGS